MVGSMAVGIQACPSPSNTPLPLTSTSHLPRQFQQPRTRYSNKNLWRSFLLRSHNPSGGESSVFFLHGAVLVAGTPLLLARWKWSLLSGANIDSENTQVLGGAFVAHLYPTAWVVDAGGSPVWSRPVHLYIARPRTAIATVWGCLETNNNKKPKQTQIV